MIELTVLLAGRVFMLALAMDTKKKPKKRKPGQPYHKRVRRWMRHNRFAGELILLLAVIVAILKEFV